MPNANRPKGLIPVAYLNGSAWNGQARRYSVPVGNATALYVGDPVTLTGSGDAFGVAGVAIGVAGSAVVGVIVGVVVANAGVSLVGTTIDTARRSLPASTAGYVLVADDPNIIFELQEAATTPFAAVDIGNNCNFLVVAGAGVNNDSGTTTAVAASAATATLNLKLLGLAQREDNEFGAFAKWLVKINNHVYGTSTGTAGI